MFTISCARALEMAGAPRLSDDITSLDTINSVAAEAQMPIRSPGPTIADMLYAARLRAHQRVASGEVPGAPIRVPGGTWRLASSEPRRVSGRLGSPGLEIDARGEHFHLMHRIAECIIPGFRYSSPVQVTQRELMQRRRAALRLRNRNRPIAVGREASEATLSTTEGSVRCCDEWSEVS